MKAKLSIHIPELRFYREIDLDLPIADVVPDPLESVIARSFHSGYRGYKSVAEAIRKAFPEAGL